MTTPNQAPRPEQAPPVTLEMVTKIGALGCEVVDFSNQSAGVITAMTPDAYTPDEVAEAEQSLDGTVNAALALQQNALRQPLTEEKSRLADFSYGVRALEPPRSLKNLFGVQDEKALVRKAVLGSENPAASVNFFQWYNSALVKKQEAFDQHELPGQLAWFQEKLRGAVDDGIAPPEVLSRFADKLASDKLHVQLTDYPTAHGNNAMAYPFRNGQYLIQVGNKVVGEERAELLGHELGHVVEGVATPDDENDPSLRPYDEIGLGRLFGSGVGARIVVEATEELFAESLVHGHIDEIHPNLPSREHSDSYGGHLYMLSVLAEAGVKKLDPRVFTRAAFSDGNLQTSPYLQSLDSELDDAYPDMHVVERIRNLEAEPGDSDAVTAVKFANRLAEEMRVKRADPASIAARI